MTNNLTVVGGGITGLAAAYMAAKKGISVRVLEASPNFGGLLNTFEVGGNRLEYFYHHFFTHDAELHWLFHELGLEDKVVFQNSTMGVYRNGKSYDFNSPIDLLKFSPLSIIGKLKFGLTSLYLGKKAKWQDFEHMPALDWFYKWAGKDATEAIWKPLHDVKFGKYAQRIPLAWMVGRLSQRMNSRKQGDEQLGYLEGSLQVLSDTLCQKLKEMGVELIPNAPIEEVLIHGDELLGVKTPKGTFRGGDFLFTIPTIHMVKLFKAQAPTYAERLDGIEYFGAVCTILDLKESLSPIYWLNVTDEGFPFGGVIEHTNLIPPKEYNGSHLVYLSKYFGHDEDIAKMSNEEIKALMLPSLKKMYPHLTDDKINEVYVFKTMTAANVCDLGFSKRIPDCKSSVKHLYYAGMPHIYPDERSANNAIRVAAEALRVLGFDMDIPRGLNYAGTLGFEKNNSRTS